jgi:hypothetical protein
MLSPFCSADWPSKSICKSVLNFRWTSLWQGGVGTAVYGRQRNDEGHLTKALSTLFGRLTTLPRQNGSLWKFRVINYTTASCNNNSYYCSLETQTEFFFWRHDWRLIKLHKSFILQHVREGNLHRRLGRTLESSTKVLAPKTEMSTTN